MNGISQFDVERVDAEYSRHSNYLFLVLAGISPNLKTRLDFNGHFTAATSVVRSGTNRSGVAQHFTLNKKVCSAYTYDNDVMEKLEKNSVLNYVQIKKVYWLLFL